MKKYGSSIVGVLLVLAAAWVAFGQAEKPQRPQRAQGQGMGQGGGGQFGAQFREAQLKAVAAVQEQIGKLKAFLEAPGPATPAGGFQNASEEERTKMREAFTQRREQQQQIMEAIDTELAKLKGARQLLREQEQGTKELQAIREVAAKEQAKETLKSIDELIAKRQKAFEDRIAKLGLQMPQPRGGGGGGGM